jgi:hypothetical protein
MLVTKDSIASGALSARVRPLQPAGPSGCREARCPYSKATVEFWDLFVSPGDLNPHVSEGGLKPGNR